MERKTETMQGIANHGVQCAASFAVDVPARAARNQVAVEHLCLSSTADAGRTHKVARRRNLNIIFSNYFGVFQFFIAGLIYAVKSKNHHLFKLDI